MHDVALFRNAHERAAVGNAFQNAVLLQAMDRFAHGRSADAELLRDGGLHEHVFPPPQDAVSFKQYFAYNFKSAACFCQPLGLKTKIKNE